MQSETRGVQIMAQSPEPAAQQFKYQMKALIDFFRTR